MLGEAAEVLRCYVEGIPAHIHVPRYEIDSFKCIVRPFHFYAIAPTDDSIQNMGASMPCQPGGARGGREYVRRNS